MFDGQLSSTRKGIDDKMVAAVFVTLDALPFPTLYEPRLVSVMGHEMRIMGLERAEHAWVLQEWDCEIMSLAPATRPAPES